MRNESERRLNTQTTAAGQEGPKSASWLLALLAGALVIAWPWLSGRVTIPWDAKAQFLPQLQFLAQSLAQGESPFWTPYVFGGHPQIADAQSLIFSPPFFLLALLDPAPTAWAMDVSLYLSLTAGAAAFMMWLVNKGIVPFAAFIGALAFAFGASMAWRVQHSGQVLSLAYLPFVLLFLDNALERQSILGGVGAGLFAAFLVLGRDQVGLLCVYFLIGYVLASWWQGAGRPERIRGSIAPLLAGGITGALIIGLPILMTLMLAGDSNRPQIDLEGAGRGSLHPALFLTALAPDVFGSSGVQQSYWGPPSPYWNATGLYIAQNMGQLYAGAVAVLALLWGVASGVFMRGWGLFFAGALVMTILYALGWYTPVFAFLHAHVPGVNLYRRPADATFMIGFLASVLAALALNHMLADKTARSWHPWAVTLGAVAAGFAGMITLAVQAGRLSDALPYILLPAGLMMAAAGLLFALSRGQAQTRTLLAATLAVFTVCDLAYSNGPGNATALPPQMYDVLHPATSNETIAELKKRVAATRSETRRDRVEIVGQGFHWPNASLTHALENTAGYNPVRLIWATRALGLGDTVGLPSQREFSPLLPSYKSPLANLLGLAVIATSVPIEEIDKSLKPGDLPLVTRTKDSFIYANPDALPRVLFAPDAATADFEAMLTTGVWPRTDFNQTVLLQAGTRPAPASRPAGSVRIVSYANTRVELEADSPEGGYAVLNDIWHPWWSARVDGKVIPVLRANVIFRAVEVPPGKHRIVFSFEPIAGAFAQLRAPKGN